MDSICEKFGNDCSIACTSTEGGLDNCLYFVQPNNFNISTQNMIIVFFPPNLLLQDHSQYFNPIPCCWKATKKLLIPALKIYNGNYKISILNRRAERYDVRRQYDRQTGSWELGGLHDCKNRVRACALKINEKVGEEIDREGIRHSITKICANSCPQTHLQQLSTFQHIFIFFSTTATSLSCSHKQNIFRNATSTLDLPTSY